MDPFDGDRPAPDSHIRAVLTFRSLSEARPGPKWRSIFRHGWPGWSDWLGDRAGDAAGVARAERALRRHMPELVGVWESLVELADGDPRAAQFLTFWSPPRYLLNCSQVAIVDADGPALIRNYDLDPALNEAALLRSAWLGRDVMGMVEGLSGLADGMNAAGLAVSLAFGGRTIAGRGFGVPLILRYLLETCRDTPDALDALRALPCHMAYNLTLIDRDGRHATVLLSPDRPAIVTAARHATNHQLGVEWPRHGRESRTLERADYLAATLADPAADLAALRARFLAPPIHSRAYARGFGTVYTAIYRPARGSVELAWPGVPPIRQEFGRFVEDARNITYVDGVAPFETALSRRAEGHSPRAAHF